MTFKRSAFNAGQARNFTASVEHEAPGMSQNVQRLPRIQACSHFAPSI